MKSTGGWGPSDQYGQGGASQDPYADEYAAWPAGGEGDYAGRGTHGGYDEYDDVGEYYDGPEEYAAPGPGQPPGESFYPAWQQPAEPYSLPGRPSGPYDFSEFGEAGQGRPEDAAGYGFDEGSGVRGRHSAPPYDERPYGDDRYPYGGDAARYGGQDTGSYGPDSGSFGRDTGSFGRGTGSFGQPEADPYGQPDGRSYGQPEAGPYRQLDAGPYGQPDTGSYGRPDTGSYGRPDTGPYGQPGTGSYGRPDTGPYDQPGTGSYGRPDTGSWRQDSGSWQQDSGSWQQDSGSWQQDSGSWQSGRGSDVAYGQQRALPAGADGYAGWHDEPEGPGDWGARDADDDDWDDDSRRGLIARRFGRGGGGDDGDDDGRDHGRRRWPRRLTVTTVALVAALVLGIGGNYGYHHIRSWLSNRYGNYTGAGHGWVTVTVPADATLYTMGPLLQKAGVIESLRPYDSAAAAAPNASSLQPGTYRMHLQMNAQLAVNLLLSGTTRQVNTFTAFPGERASHIATRLAKQTGLPVSQFTALIDHPTAALGLPKWGEKTAEGFLFPDTYTLAPHESALQILQMMVSNFKTKVASLHVPALAASKSVTPLQALTAASLIQDEGGNLSDYPKISRVIWNRIQKGMLLQFDSTVFFAMGTYGTSITKADEAFKSPYNTYLHTGLPPGPISSPGLAAISASLHAPHGQCWLYFITDLRGKPPHTTHFTCSLSQLQQWQTLFQG
jgi:UPF0755 protein